MLRMFRRRIFCICVVLKMSVCPEIGASLPHDLGSDAQSFLRWPFAGSDRNRIFLKIVAALLGLPNVECSDKAAALVRFYSG